MTLTLKGTGLRRYTRKHLRHDRDAARAEILRLEGVIRGLDTTVRQRDDEIAQLKADAVDVSVERKLRKDAERRAKEADSRYLVRKSAHDNQYSVTVPPMHRDIDPDEQPTVPRGTPALTLPQALGHRANAA